MAPPLQWLGGAVNGSRATRIAVMALVAATLYVAIVLLRGSGPR